MDAFGIRAKRVQQQTWAHLYLSAGANKWHPNPLTTWLRDLGVWGLRSHEKFIPQEIFRLPSAQIALFLKHLWATDGCVFVRTPGTKGPRGRIYYATNSLRLAKDVQHLLARLAIVARIQSVRKLGFKPGYHVTVSGTENQRRFALAIGAFGPRRDPMAGLEAALVGVTGSAKSDSIPVEIWWRVSDRMAELGVTANQLERRRASNTRMRFHLPPRRDVVEELGGLLDDPELKQIAAAEVYWDSVKSIDLEGVEEVYDMTVPGTHNFVANGIVLSNSIEQDSDLVMFIYRDEVYNPDSEQKGEAELIVAKHRNGPTGLLRLAFMNQYTKFANIARGPGF
jgi:replicative DNA helicase